MGLRLAGFEALQAGGLLEFGAREDSAGRCASSCPTRSHEHTAEELDDADDKNKLRILLVDDHDVVHWGFRQMLGTKSWVERTLSSRTGEEAYALAERYKPDVALVDLFIGEESGAEICHQLRERSPTPRCC